MQYSDQIHNKIYNKTKLEMTVLTLKLKLERVEEGDGKREGSARLLLLGLVTMWKAEGASWSSLDLSRQ